MACALLGWNVVVDEPGACHAPLHRGGEQRYEIPTTTGFRFEEIEAVADAFGQVIDQVCKIDQTTASAQQVRAEIVKSYPFHPGIRDLYARFRENQGLQQTRALIRVMRMVVAGLWHSGAAHRAHLIGGHNLDFHNPDVLNEIRMINRALDNAIAHDVAEDNHGAVLESYARGASRDEREKELRGRLEEMVKPKVGDLYGEVKALPALDQVHLTADRVTLVVMRPDVGAHAEMRRFFDAQQFKNRFLFLTAREAEYQPVLQRLAYLRAIDAIIKEFREQGVWDTDGQMQDAVEIKSKQEVLLRRLPRSLPHHLVPVEERADREGARPQVRRQPVRG